MIWGWLETPIYWLAHFNGWKGELFRSTLVAHTATQNRPMPPRRGELELRVGENNSGLRALALDLQQNSLDVSRRPVIIFIESRKCKHKIQLWRICTYLTFLSTCMTTPLSKTNREVGKKYSTEFNLKEKKHSIGDVSKKKKHRQSHGFICRDAPVLDECCQVWDQHPKSMPTWDIVFHTEGASYR